MKLIPLTLSRSERLVLAIICVGFFTLFSYGIIVTKLLFMCLYKILAGLYCCHSKCSPKIKINDTFQFHFRSLACQYEKLKVSRVCIKSYLYCFYRSRRWSIGNSQVKLDKKKNLPQKNVDKTKPFKETLDQMTCHQVSPLMGLDIFFRLRYIKIKNKWFSDTYVYILNEEFTKL